MRSRLVLLGLTLLAFLVSAILSGRSLLFVRGAEKTLGAVIEIEGSNSTCRKRKRKRNYDYDCTKFQGLIEYTSAAGNVLTLKRGAGQVRGHNQPVSSASYTVGQKVTVLYDRDDPSDARLDSFEDLWLGASVAAFIGLIMGICILLPTRRR